MSVAKIIYDVCKNIGIYNLLSDELYTKLKYRLKMGKSLDLISPETFTEKLNYLKLTDHNALYIDLVDKYEVETYVEKKIGFGYCAKKYGIWNNFNDIDFNSLPDKFVLKCTHDSGGVVICRNKNNFNIQKARDIIERSLKRNYFWHNREWPYKKIKPRVLAEEYLEDESGIGLVDYKFFCFDGIPIFMFIATGRAEGNTCFDFFDMDFNWIPVKQHYPNAEVRPKKPECFEHMQELAKKLSKGLKHVRIDFYQVNGKIYFGEFTFTHFGGFERFEPNEYDYIFGNYLKI